MEDKRTKQPEDTAEFDANFNIEEELRLHQEAQAKHEEIVRKYDLLAGIFIILFALFFIIGGLKMPVASLTGDASQWYLSPGFMPVICGVVLILLSILLIKDALHAGTKFTSNDRARALEYLKSEKFFRLITAGVFLSIYLFIMLRRIDYFIATFIYMVVNMIVFTSKKRTVKQIIIYIVISLAAAGAITYGFGTLAQIPLP